MNPLIRLIIALIQILIVAASILGAIFWPLLILYITNNRDWIVIQVLYIVFIGIVGFIILISYDQLKVLWLEYTTRPESTQHEETKKEKVNTGRE